MIKNKVKQSKNLIIGYTDGTFDLFHYGHINFLKEAKNLCDYLIVGVNNDKIVSNYKKNPIMSSKERLAVIQSCKYVDYAFINDSRNKLLKHKQFKFNVLFVGSDWKGTKRWIKFEKELSKYNVKICYLNYTKTISTTIIRKRLQNEKA